MSYIRLVDVKVSARLGYELTAASLTFDISPRTFITATVDILPQTSLDPDTVFALDQLLPFEIGKVTLDIAVTEDGIDSIGIVKALDDQVAVSVDTAFDVSKPEVDIATALDAFDRVYLSDRQFTDGSVVLDTPPTITAGKALTDVASMDSLVSFSLSRAFSDSVTLLDNAKVIQGIFVNVGRWFDVSTWGKDTWDDTQYWDEDSGDDIHSVIMGSDFSYEAEFHRDFSDQLTPQDIFTRQVDYRPSISDEVVTGSAITTVSFGKGLVDTAVTGDILGRDVGYNRVLVDTTNTASDVELTLGTLISDTTTIQDAQQLGIQPSVFDSVASGDSIDTFGVTLGKVDTAIMGDTLDRNVDYDRGLDDSVASGDSIDTFSVTLGKVDTAIVADMLDRNVDYDRGLDDSVASGDSIDTFGVTLGKVDTAVLDDDITLAATFNRGLGDITATESSVAIGVSTLESDALVVSDVSHINPIKVLSDSASAVDQIGSQLVTKSLADTASTSDEIDLLYAVGRILADTASTSDQGQYAYTAYWDDGVTWMDARSWLESRTEQI